MWKAPAPSRLSWNRAILTIRQSAVPECLGSSDCGVSYQRSSSDPVSKGRWESCLWSDAASRPSAMVLIASHLVSNGGDGERMIHSAAENPQIEQHLLPAHNVPGSLRRDHG